jgi:hypothetical protein
MPDIPEQTNMIRCTAQRDYDKPSRNHHHRDRGDIDSKDIDLCETHYTAPESK